MQEKIRFFLHRALSVLNHHADQGCASPSIKITVSTKNDKAVFRRHSVIFIAALDGIDGIKNKQPEPKVLIKSFSDE